MAETQVVGAIELLRQAAIRLQQAPREAIIHIPGAAPEDGRDFNRARMAVGRALTLVGREKGTAIPFRELAAIVHFFADMLEE